MANNSVNIDKPNKPLLTSNVERKSVERMYPKPIPKTCKGNGKSNQNSMLLENEANLADPECDSRAILAKSNLSIISDID